MTQLTPELKRDWRGVSFALVSAALGVILMRVIVYGLPIDTSGYGGSLAVNAIFATFTQLVFLLAVPFCVYKFYGRRTVKETLEYSSFRGFKPYHLLALPLGFCVFFVTLGMSSLWGALLRATGYKYTSSVPLPEVFNGGFFVADILLTAVLPAVCEEFCMRGGVLTTAKTALKPRGCIIACAIAFGLFHQNIRQVFYTALFGALAAYLILKLKSIYPAVIMHFANNFLSVYLDYASAYDWAVGGAFYDVIESFAVSRIWAIALIAAAVIVIGIGLVLLMIFFKDRRVIEKKIETVKDAAFDATNKRVVLFGEFDEQKIAGLEMEKEVYGKDYVEQKYKPSLRDIMIIIGVGTVTLLTTVFTYVWGFFY